MKDPHNYQGRLEQTVRKLKISKDFSKKDKNAILRFKDDCLLQISTGRVLRYVQCLMSMKKWIKKDFVNATKNDVKKIIAELNNSNYTEWTMLMFKITLRKFYKFLKNTEDFPKEVKWIKTTVKKRNRKLPEELLTEDEVKRLINASAGMRDRAFVSVLYESGCRLGEMLSLKIKNVGFDKYGAQILVNGKTGPRRIRLISSVPYTTEWLNKHPCKNDMESPLWIGKSGDVLSYARVRDILLRLKKASGIKKKVNPHNFRHSRATYLANHLTEAQMKEFFGWVQASEMASVYVHLSGRDVDNALLKVYGIKNNEEKEESKLKPRDCPRCEEVNPATNKFCNKCGMALDKETMIEIVEKDFERRKADELLDKLMKDEKFKEMFLGKIKEVIK